MEYIWLLHNLVVALGLLEECTGFPLHQGTVSAGGAGWSSTFGPVGAFTLLGAVAVALLGCVCCRQRKGFEELTESVVRQQSGAGYVNRAASELTMFPPPGAGAGAGAALTVSSWPGPGIGTDDRASVVQFEPLPDLKQVAAARHKPAAFSNSITHSLSAHDWFDDPQRNFPRNHLQYLRELGRGWFGRVVEGKAKGIVPGEAMSKVVVKILHEDATPMDQSYFLHEVKAYRDLKHPNVIRLLGRCLETHPFLLLLEDCPSGNLKTFLSQNVSAAKSLSQQGVTLEMACGVAAGLQHMVENGFVHTDLAARNCLVTSDLTVKVGDYGTSIETFKDEYYCAGDLAIPIRWVAPETLHCTDSTIETKQVTDSANVWSLAVVLWEIYEFGRLPYTDLTDEEVIEHVIGSGSTCLPFPSEKSQPHVHNLYHLMKICWVESAKRPKLDRVLAMLQHLHQHRNSPAHTSANNNNNSTTSLDDFERRWEMSKPNTVPKLDNEIGTVSVQSSPIRAVTTQRRLSLEENIPVMSSATLQLNMNTADLGTSNADSPQLSLASSLGGEYFVPSSTLSNHKSPSMLNLRGSVDELHTVDTNEAAYETKATLQTPETVIEEPDFDSWLKGMNTSTEEDVRFVRNISEAIRDLDDVLAQEKTSSSSQSSSTHHSPSQITTREVVAGSMPSDLVENVVLDFRLGPLSSTPSVKAIGSSQYEGQDSLSLTHHRLESSGSDTEDETWRIRIEKGEFSEKVKEKSKSVADLMVLTHIEYSDGSDSDTTLDVDSFCSGFRKNSVGRRSFHRKPLQSTSSGAYGSEGNIHGAVLGEEFRETIKRLQEAWRYGTRLDAIPDTSLSYVSINSNETPPSLPPNTSGKNHFLAKDASETKNMKSNFENPIDSSANNFDSDSDTGKLCEVLCEGKGCCENNAVRSSEYISTEDEVRVAAQSMNLEYEECLQPESSCNVLISSHAVQQSTPIRVPGSSETRIGNFLLQQQCSEKMETKNLLSSTPSNRDDGKSPPNEKNGVGSTLTNSVSLDLIENVSSPKCLSITSNGTQEQCMSHTENTVESHAKNEDASRVILGPFEDSTLDYFKGLKTTFPAVNLIDYSNKMNNIELDDNSIDTWDKFLDHSMQPPEGEYPSFSDVSFTKSEPVSPINAEVASDALLDILGSSFEKSTPEESFITPADSSKNYVSPTMTSPVLEFVCADDVLITRAEHIVNGGPQKDTRFCLSSPHKNLLGCDLVPSAVTDQLSQQSSSALIIPSVKVTGATPVPSGRSSPNDLDTKPAETDITEQLSTESEGNHLGSGDKVEVCSTAISKGETACNILGSYVNDKQGASIEDDFASEKCDLVVPESISSYNVTKCDPYLPCCNQLVDDFIVSQKSFSATQNTSYEIFSLNAAHASRPNEDISNGLSSDCYLVDKMGLSIIEKEFKPVIPIFSKGLDSKEDGTGETEDEDEFGIGVSKNLTPDDERSSDSGFRDKGSLSESCEDACDEKYNLEDVEVELEEAFSKGVFARHDSPISAKCLEADCDAVDESFSVTLTDLEHQRKLQDVEGIKTDFEDDPCQRLDVLLRGDAALEPLSVSIQNTSDFFGASPEISPIPQSSGWYLHPQPSLDVVSTEQNSGNDSSYFSFSLDEEFVNAIRNELLEKLPCAQQQQHEDSQPQLSDEEGSNHDPDSEDSPTKDHTNIMIHYKTYPAPLSPILEERESVSSESCSPFGGPKTSSCSEDISPVFTLHRPPSVHDGAGWQFDDDTCQDKRDGLAEVDGDLSDDAGDCMLLDDLDQKTQLVDAGFYDSNNSRKMIAGVATMGQGDDDDEEEEEEDDDDDDDVLVVNTETNEAFLLESPKPRSSYNFGNKDNDRNSNFVPDFLSVAGTYQLPDSRFQKIENPLASILSRECPLTLPLKLRDSDSEEDCDAMTPDSIMGDEMPGVIGTGSGTVSLTSSPETGNMSAVLTPSDKSVSLPRSNIHASELPRSCETNSLKCASISAQNLEEIQDISVIGTNIEGLEIISDMESSGIFSSRFHPSACSIIAGEDSINHPSASPADLSELSYSSLAIETDISSAQTSLSCNKKSPSKCLIHLRSTELGVNCKEDIHGNTGNSDPSQSEDLEMTLSCISCTTASALESVKVTQNDVHPNKADDNTFVNLELVKQCAETSSFLVEESAFCTSEQHLSTSSKTGEGLLVNCNAVDAPFVNDETFQTPPLLKEIAKNALGCEDHVQAVESTLAFTCDETAPCLDAPSPLTDSSPLEPQNKLVCLEDNVLSTNYKIPRVCIEDVKESKRVSESTIRTTEVTKTESKSSSELNDPRDALQTLAFNDPEKETVKKYPGAGHLVVGSIIAPLTPSDEVAAPGTLAFNDSPISPNIPSHELVDIEPNEAESHLMSTSFMSADDIEEDREDRDQYTPDWESESDCRDSDTNSSSSGEFIWKAYSHTFPEFPMTSILEEDEDGSGSGSDSSDSEDDADFVPSAWDCQATPSRSALRSPDKKLDQKKNVSFKRQRYHCVYEYPRELSDSDGSEYAESPSRRRTWDLDFSGYGGVHDWELLDGEMMPESKTDLKMDQCVPSAPASSSTSSPLSASSASQRLFDFYKLSSMDYGFGNTMVSDDGEFFISSSAQPFHSIAETCAPGGSEFFPGRDLTASSVDDPEVTEDASELISVVQNGQSDALATQCWRHTEDLSDSDSSDTNLVTASEGSLSHQKSVDSNSSSIPMLTANGGSNRSSEDSSSDVYHSLPSNQELRVDSGSDSPLSELSPPSPLSPMSPSQGLGELRHTRDRLKLDLPTTNTTFVLSAPAKRRSVEQVKGEASLLDGEDLEDSGIESSNAGVSGRTLLGSDEQCGSES